MRHEPAHPIWVHIPAVSLLIVMTALALLMPVVAGPAAQAAFAGSLGDGTSQRESAGMLAFLGVVLILYSVIADELWARAEKRKRFNWLSVVDDLLVAVLVVQCVVRPLLTGSPARLQWTASACLVAIAGTAAVLVELCRPFRRVAQPPVPEDISAVANRLAESGRLGRSWAYWDVYNPWWMRWSAAAAVAFWVAVAIGWTPGRWWEPVVALLVVIGLLRSYGGVRTAVTPVKIERWVGLFGARLPSIDLVDVVSVGIRRYSSALGFGRAFIVAMRSGSVLSSSRPVVLKTVTGCEHFIASDRPEQLSAAIEIAMKHAK